MRSVPRSVPEPGIGTRALGSVPDHKNEKNDVLKAKTEPFCHQTLPGSIFYENEYFYELSFKKENDPIDFNKIKGCFKREIDPSFNFIV